ncbi:carboxymuconolactone decarboxylase family protein [Saccharothrix syringae]|uniref:Carboxymuconolactone decarboxylase family protein n=1 Tax=Saccharothrix syringae TaxID=103733 RepID=A0A5Q0GVD7_SACSY|nr:carboxymuconolactone decarboxylase family protein [Saccharothrix syringae]QFZ17322.1 carboxymuconolactone decarboxylase family protein [Saccharothrix syringae]
MARIPVVPARGASALVKIAYRLSRRKFGAVPEPVAVSAHHRKLMVVGARHELGVERAARVLPVSLRELVVYATAVKLGCSWCVDFGTMLIKHEGLDVDRLREIGDYANSDRYTELEKLALAYADAMTDTPVTVTDEQVAELDRRLGHDGLVELTYLIALENNRGRFNSALGITDQGFTSGDACRVPMP